MISRLAIPEFISIRRSSGAMTVRVIRRDRRRLKLTARRMLAHGFCRGLVCRSLRVPLKRLDSIIAPDAHDLFFLSRVEIVKAARKTGEGRYGATRQNT